jgi:hypothetical protein
MSVAPCDQSIEAMRRRTTDDLLAIWQLNDRNQWSGSEFDAISDVLFERGIVAPAQEGYVPPPPLKGVRGWLLFFCVKLVFIGPLANFVVAKALAETENMPVAVWSFVLAISGFSIYAGVELWRVAPGAVKKAKAFLWTYLTCTAGGGLLLLILSDEANARILADMFRSDTYFGIWYLYLIQSRRVRDTYGY